MSKNNKIKALFSRKKSNANKMKKNRCDSRDLNKNKNF